ncbi:MAG: DNA alkylation repair protein [Bacillota bacterium]
MRCVQAVMTELHQYADKEKAEYFLKSFFKASPGGYAEGDRFIGVTVPNQRKVARKFFKQISLEEIKDLLHQPIHEYRLTALFILVLKYEKSMSDYEQKAIVDLYLDNTAYVNNWDLVDSSADKILGPYLFHKEKGILDELANSNDLWKQRIAIIATFHFIKNYKYDDTLRIASILLRHKHDLIHKAVGWMLREIGNRDFEVEYNFLRNNYKGMPRTMLRYAIEKFDEELRQQFLKGLI